MSEHEQIDSNRNDFTRQQLLELFGSGTACVVSPIERIQYHGTDIHIPTMHQERPVFEAMRTELADIQYGKKPHPWAVTID